jgi:hypothetical protein
MERIFRNAEDEKRFKALEEHLDIKFRAGDGRIAVCGRASDQGKPSMIIINDLELFYGIGQTDSDLEFVDNLMVTYYDLPDGEGEFFPVYLRDERRDEFKSKYLEQGTK